jgi:hypothetical protein
MLQALPAALRELMESLLETRRDIALAIERRNGLLHEACIFLEHRNDQIFRNLFKPRQGKNAVQIGQFFDNEMYILGRGAIGHSVSTSQRITG